MVILSHFNKYLKLAGALFFSKIIAFVTAFSWVSFKEISQETVWPAIANIHKYKYERKAFFI